MTKQKRVILEELERVRTHPTADELYGIVRKRIPRISLGTVYRNLEMLAASGRIRTIRTCGKQRRFDADLSDHVHASCIRCGKIKDLPGGFPIGRLDGNLDESEFTYIATRIEIIGICGDCKREEETREG